MLEAPRSGAMRPRRRRPGRAPGGRPPRSARRAPPDGKRPLPRARPRRGARARLRRRAAPASSRPGTPLSRLRNSRPVSPSAITSAGPPSSGAITARPAAMPSITTWPNGSGMTEAWTSTSKRAQLAPDVLAEAAELDAPVEPELGGEPVQIALVVLLAEHRACRRSPLAPRRLETPRRRRAGTGPGPSTARSARASRRSPVRRRARSGAARRDLHRVGDHPAAPARAAARASAASRWSSRSPRARAWWRDPAQAAPPGAGCSPRRSGRADARPAARPRAAPPGRRRRRTSASWCARGRAQPAQPPREPRGVEERLHRRCASGPRRAGPRRGADRASSPAARAPRRRRRPAAGAGRAARPRRGSRARWTPRR